MVRLCRRSRRLRCLAGSEDHFTMHRKTVRKGPRQYLWQNLGSWILDHWDLSMSDQLRLPFLNSAIISCVTSSGKHSGA